MPAFGNLGSADGLKKLNEHLESRSYITGYSASADDASTFAQVGGQVDQTKYAHVARWYTHISALTALNKLKAVAAAAVAESKAGAAAPAPAAKAAAPAKAAADDDDDDNAFSFDDEEPSEDAAAILARKKAEADAEKKDKKKDDKVARSTIVLDVKPTEAETDLGALEKSIRGIVMDGLLWGACERIPVAYGVKKLRILATIVDDLVSVDDMQAQIEAFEDCQSTDIYAFNKV